MPTKTDRILGYLPATFRALPKPTALHTVADAFGSELLHAENSLAALMLAHWVDHADRGAELIDDLAGIAALYGLWPRPDEDVEEFREHLKRYVRTFLDGTVTVQGILRVTAEVLGLHIADEYAEMDTWWTRADDSLTRVEPRGDDAADLLFGVTAAAVSGEAARPAEVTGRVAPGDVIDLRGASNLSVTLDDAAEVRVDFAALLPDLSAAKLSDIAESINNRLGAQVASAEGGRLRLTSTTPGAASRLEIGEGADDAAARLLGLLPHTYRGAEATAAQITGLEDLGRGVNLSEARYLRLAVDGTLLAEVDCAAGSPGSKTLQQVADAINAQLGAEVAAHDGRHLILTSPTRGSASSVEFQTPAAQDAKEKLFGAVEAFHVGRDARPAKVVGARDLGFGVDLSGRSLVRVQIDDQPAYTVDCAGEAPGRTRPAEIAAALNDRLGGNVASQDGTHVILTSPTRGANSSIRFEPLPPDEDAVELIFGIGSRVFQGAAARRARLVGGRDLGALVDLGALHFIQVSIDGNAPVEIDLRAEGRRRATLDEIRDAINAALGPSVASHDDRRLTLASPTVGGPSRVRVEPLTETRRRRFVTRAFITDEAALPVFGFHERRAVGEGATRARLLGGADLSRGVDLSDARFIRLAVDGSTGVDIDCAGTRPRATLVGEVVSAINDAIGGDAEVATATPDGRFLVLTSPTSGAGSRLAFEQPRAADASAALLGRTPDVFRGRGATSVRLVGTTDLSAGIDLSASDKIRLGIDGATHEISCAGADPAHTTLEEIVLAINVAFDDVVAAREGSHVVLTSPSEGTDSRITFPAQAEPNAVAAIFGFRPPRTYRGTDALPARIVGLKNLREGADLRTARFLRLAVNGSEPLDIDCVSGVAADADRSKVELGKVVSAVNGALTAAALPAAATDDGTHLIISTTSTGANERIELLPHLAADARARLFGDVPEELTGSDPVAAVIKGEADLLTPVNLAERRTLRLSVDGGQPTDVDVTGAAPDTTFLEEIIDGINAVFAGLASATPDDRLQLVSPTRGDSSRVEVLPLRVLELIEYPPETAASPEEGRPPRAARHGDRWHVSNEGAADADLMVELSAPRGAVGPGLFNFTTGARVRLLSIVRPGERVTMQRDAESGLRAEIIAADGSRRRVPASQVQAGPAGPQVWVPFEGEWEMSDGDGDDPASLQLNNPPSRTVIVLHARGSGGVRVSVTEAQTFGPEGAHATPEGVAAKLTGRVRAAAGDFRLTDAGGAETARLRPGAGISLDDYRDRVVVVTGQLFAEEGAPPLLLLERIDALFDVTLSREGAGDSARLVESYEGVTIGTGPEARDQLAYRINGGAEPSRLVRASEAGKAEALALPRGRTRWGYLDCYGARFDSARFDESHFAGGVCAERAIFDVSRFTRQPPWSEASVFASAEGIDDPPVGLRLRWHRHQAGAFVVNLPADLPERFGGRFNETFFSRPGDAPETFADVVTEPETDDDYIVRRLQASKLLVEVVRVGRVPIGFEAVTMPFRKPRRLTGGGSRQRAQMFIAEKDVPGFIQVRSRLPGALGNAIALTARRSGPARFDVTVSYQGARFESARSIVLGGAELPVLAEEILRPGAIGLLQAKAAGVQVRVTRDRTQSGE